MALNYAKYQRKSETEWTVVAKTVKEEAGKKGKISFIPGNLRDKSKAVAVVIEHKDGNSVTVPCTRPLSEAIRSGKIGLKHIAGLPIHSWDYEGDEITMITLPGTGGLSFMEVDNINIEEFDFSSLVAA
jgi:hypothetical protein